MLSGISYCNKSFHLFLNFSIVNMHAYCCHVNVGFMEYSTRKCHLPQFATISTSPQWATDYLLHAMSSECTLIDRCLISNCNSPLNSGEPTYTKRWYNLSIYLPAWFIPWHDFLIKSFQTCCFWWHFHLSHEAYLRAWSGMVFIHGPELKVDHNGSITAITWFCLYHLLLGHFILTPKTTDAKFIVTIIKGTDNSGHSDIYI